MTADEIVARWREETDRLALAFVGEPDNRVEASLAGFADRIAEAWAAIFPGVSVDQLSEIAKALVLEVLARRKEIEAARGAFAQQQPGPDVAV